MAEHSAGILLRRAAPEPAILLGHMGGPFWARKDAAAWSIPKGLIEPHEGELDAALREFEEELGLEPPRIVYSRLGDFRYSSGKVVTVFLGDADLDLAGFSSATFELEWPPRSGRRARYPEFDVVRWVPIREAREKLVAGQRAAVDALVAAESVDGREWR
jgi:predicted NUDIX family NTP pyrophosphohydrolase